jgi:putative phage-type endonuclease
MKETRDKWLAERKKGIGGSEIAAVIGIDEYRTPLDIYLDKTGQKEDEPDNKFFRAGRNLEPVVVKYFEEETGIKTIYEKDKIYIHPKHKEVRGTPDRLFGHDGVLECKVTTRKINGEDDVPKSYFCQLQYYLGLTGRTKGYLAFFKNTWEFIPIYYEADPELFSMLVDEAVKFWNNHVLSGIPPEPRNSNDIVQLYAKHNEGKYITASEELYKQILYLKSVQNQIKELEKIEAEKKEQVQLILKDAEGIKYNENTLVTWKAAKESYVFDKELFKKEQPTMFTKYMIKKPGSRRFLFKI